MAITNIKVSNFKSFKDLDLNLGRFNVVIGANASGKSNFVEIFRFLRTFERESLDDTISLHGGPPSIVNLRLGLISPLRMSATFDKEMTWGGAWYAAHVSETTYDFSLQLGNPENKAVIKSEQFIQKAHTKIGNEDAEFIFRMRLSEEELSCGFTPHDVVDRLEKERASSESASLHSIQKDIENLRKVLDAIVRREGSILFTRPRILFPLIGPFEGMFERIGVYDIEPHAVKRPHETAGRASLEDNGENLALVLRQILADNEKSRKFHNLLQYMLPFAKGVGVEQYLGVSLLLKLREEYYENSLLANLLSDGTVDVVALIVALFFEDKDVVIIEEPERNIHPHLISGLMRLMEDAARNKQIIITTHSPEVVRHAGVENLLLMSRDKDGFSTVSRPAEKEGVRIFLKNELGLDELFVQNALSV